MTTNFEKTSANEGTLTFEIPLEEVNKSLDQVYKRVRKNISVPGFRKGKVPRQIFNNVYGEAALYEDALNQLLPVYYQKAVDEKELEVVAQPEIDVKSMEKGQPWVIEAKVTLKPEVKLGQYKDLTVEKQDREVKEEEVEARLELKRQELAELAVTEEAAAEGNTVVIDYEGSVDGEVFEGGQAENHSLELGSGSFIPGFEEQLIGAKPGEELDVNVTFPEEYHAEELAGKEAVFKVKVHEVKAKEVPALDDEFAKDADEEVETLAELENKIRVQLTEEKEAAAKEAVEDLALRQAVENAEIVELPQAMVDQEIERQMSYFLNNLQRQGINEELFYQISGQTKEDLQAQYAEEAELRTKTNLVLEAIVTEEAIEVSEDEINAEVESLASQYNMEVEQVRGFVSTDMLESDVRLKKAMSLIVDSVEEK